MAWKFLDALAARKAPQPGADPQANTPEIHLTPHAPEAMRAVDVIGGELTDVEANRAPVLQAVRSWRAGSMRTADVSGDVALGDDRGTAAGAHMTTGAPDARRNSWAPSGHTSAPAGGVFDETHTNTRGAVALSPASAPERTRAGFTGTDPTRTAQMVVAHTIRPFDKGIADHPGVVDKAGQPNPTASRPPQRGRLAGARPSAGGSGAGTGMLPVDGHRNTVRRQPGPWAAGLTEDTTAPNLGAVQRAKGWRA